MKQTRRLERQDAINARISGDLSYNAIIDCIGRVIMATNLVVRNVEEDIALALKQRAAKHGRSAEAEHREILKAALQRPPRRSLAELLASMPNVGDDTDFDCRNG